MTQRKKLALASAAVLLTLVVSAALWFGLFLLRPVAPATPQPLLLPAGASFAKVAGILADGGVIASRGKFELLARMRGDATRIKAGTYAFQEPATPGQVLDRLVAGDVMRLQFTIPEGFTLAEIAARLEAEKFIRASDFLALTRAPAFLRELGVAAPSLEGYLFPETYTVVAGSSPRNLIETMVRQFRSRVDAKLVAAANKQGLSLHQLVTLASIIQKEAGTVAEMPLISAVFHNRLQQGIPLQADPTVIYGIEDFDGNLTRAHLATATPYNTYRMRGLPPTPIASPGEQALRAAAQPADVDYLYFVARGDGTHVFSTTLKEHNRNVRRFQLRR